MDFETVLQFFLFEFFEKSSGDLPSAHPTIKQLYWNLANNDQKMDDGFAI